MMASLGLGGVDLARGFYPLLTHLCYPLSNSAMHYSTLISTLVGGLVMLCVDVIWCGVQK